MRRENGNSRGVKLSCNSFETPLGVAGVIFDGQGRVLRLVLPSSAKYVKNVLAGIPRKDLPTVRKKIQLYFNGEKVSFADVACNMENIPPFHRRAYSALRKVTYGKVVTYGDLAKMARSPNAARAVGSAMSRNPLPLIIPCHRVIKSDGTMGNFSAETGISLKRKMLEMEAAF